MKALKSTRKAPLALNQGIGLGDRESVAKAITYAPSRLADSPLGMQNFSRGKLSLSDHIYHRDSLSGCYLT